MKKLAVFEGLRSPKGDNLSFFLLPPPCFIRRRLCECVWVFVQVNTSPVLLFFLREDCVSHAHNKEKKNIQ
jgi:hypothetical protein